ncbi:MAG: flagellar basal body-associated FliL family protein [Pikeienuella sp.]
MADAPVEVTEDEGDDAAPKRSRKPLLIGLVLFVLLGAGGFYATFSGMLSVSALLGGGDSPAEDAAQHNDGPTFAFVPIGEIIVPLGPKANSDFLILEATIEINPEEKDAIEAQMPRIRDLFNTYLRAVEARDLEAQDATLRLRAQLLRRLIVLLEPLKPQDLLFTTFILR